MPAHSDSDSEGDPDYAPPVEPDSSSDEEELVTTADAAPKSQEQMEAEKAAEKKARDDLWASFQASVAANGSASSTKTEPTPPVPMVKIEKSFRFAGEIVKEVVEVPEDSPDAKKWPLWRLSVEEEAPTAPEALQTSTSTSTPAPAPDKLGSEPPSVLPTSQPTSVPNVAGKRPAPRKPKTKLAALPSSSSQKPKKLSTLNKSAMDWHAHVDSQADSGVKDELEANRRGGGYLEKVEFLHRVEERRESVFEATKTAKRRRM